MKTKIKITDGVLKALERMRIYSSVMGNGSRLSVNEELHFDTGTKIEPYVAFCRGNTFFGFGSFSYSWVQLEPEQSVGRYCSIATGVKNFSVKHPIEHLSTSHFNGFNSIIYRQHFFDSGKAKQEYYNTIPYNVGRYLPAEIGHDVWIGEGALLGRNISIGTGAIIAANAVVTHDVPPYAIVAGVPARVVRYRFPESLIERLLKSEWWRYSHIDFHQMHYSEPDRFVGEFEEAKAAGKVSPFEAPAAPFAERLVDELERAGEPVPQSLYQAIAKGKQKKRLDEEFPVPDNCSTWHPAELDTRDGKTMRFFAYRAWLDLPIAQSHTHFDVLIHHRINSEATKTFRICLDGEVLPCVRTTRDEFNRERLRFQLPPRSSDIGCARFEFRSEVTSKPALVHPHSTDQRPLSLAISAPQLISQSDCLQC